MFRILTSCPFRVNQAKKYEYNFQFKNLSPTKYDNDRKIINKFDRKFLNVTDNLPLLIQGRNFE